MRYWVCHRGCGAEEGQAEGQQVTPYFRHSLQIPTELSAMSWCSQAA